MDCSQQKFTFLLLLLTSLNFRDANNSLVIYLYNEIRIISMNIYLGNKSYSDDKVDTQ